MPGPPPARTVEIVLRCYPRRWRRRHGDEAAELAALLMRDGVPARSIAWSYLNGAARERLTPRPGRRLAAAATVLLAAVASVGAPLALLSATAPASAASAARAHLARQGDGAAHLESLLHCGGLLGETVREALPALEGWHVNIVWAAAGRNPRRSAPRDSYYVAGGRVLAPAVIAIRVTAQPPVRRRTADGHGRPC